MDSSALMTITNRTEAVMVKGEGSYLYDASGKAYLDFVQGWAVNALGHSPKEIVNALNEQSQQLVNPSPAFYNQPMIELADLLVANSCFEKVFFANSGAEANEGAIKLARKWGSKNKNGAFEIITFDKGFHGRTLATMSASGKKGWDSIFAPMPDGFAKATLNDLASVETKINDNTVAVMLEPIQGEGGVIPAETEFLRQLRQLTQKHNLLLIVDEVQTGMGRTGHRFAYQSADIEPDIMTLGKGLGGGVPLSALLAKEEVCCFEPGDQGGTYNGNPLMTAVGLAVAQRVLDDEFLSSVREKSSYLRNKLEGLSEQFNLGKVRGQGLLLRLSLKGQVDGPTIVKEALEQGLLLNAPNADLLRFMPALNVAEEEIDQMVELLVETLRVQIQSV